MRVKMSTTLGKERAKVIALPVMRRAMNNWTKGFIFGSIQTVIIQAIVVIIFKKYL